MAIAGLHDKAVMDADSQSADLQAKKTRMKHMGEFKETKTPVVIAFRTLPNDSENCLVVAPKFLPDVYNEALMKAVESEGGQAENELGTYLGRQTFPNGENMLEMLHNQNYLKKQSTTAIMVTYGVGKDGEISLDKLNNLIAKEKGVKVSELAIADTSKAEETNKKVIKDAKKSSKKKT
tara:strand:+ start:139 stop:675 length:537 start_codon:yes stop_codon:yes gene_type:complete